MREWAWMNGSNNTGCFACGPNGVYGTLGTPAATNFPGGRVDAASWTDGNGNFWVFGGLGWATSEIGGALAYLNDLWEYNPSTGEWAWMGGNGLAPNVLFTAQPGVYGTLGVPAPGNTPGGRIGARSWVDPSGNFWIFGGTGGDSAGKMGQLNDLWEFSPTTLQWTWVAGSNTTDALGVYGTLGIGAAANSPGARAEPSLWTDNAGNLWLFGGYGFDSNGVEGFLNDLWVFKPSTGQWAWIGGGNTVPGEGNGPTGLYGTLGTPAAGNAPGGRDGTSVWTDGSGNFWLFGGFGSDSAGTQGSLNDVWEFNPSTAEWTWMGGSSTADQPASYALWGGFDPGNNPGARWGAARAIDPSGNIWFLGGDATDATGAEGQLNDLWEFNPGTGQWAWMGGSTALTPQGVYGTLGVFAPGNQPGGRFGANGWTDSHGNLWFFGGNGVAGYVGYLNDMWEYQASATSTPTAGPVFSIPPSIANIYYSPLTLAITDPTPGASIYYTTDGTTPTTSSTLYTGPLQLTSSATINAMATASGYTPSGVVTAFYTIEISTLPPAATPSISPASGTYPAAQTVTLTDTTPGASIYYTVDGSTPTQFSAPYSSPITVSTTGTLQAVAVASGYSTSGVATASYVITGTPTFTTLARFGPANNFLEHPLVQGTDGNFYGTVFSDSDHGSAFQVTPSGALTLLYNFCAQPDCTDGESPQGLTLANDGNFYGTLYSGGPDMGGSIFSMTNAGQVTSVYGFCTTPGSDACASGQYPNAAPVQASDGNFYGNSSYCAANCDGTFFRLTPGGVLTPLHTFSNPDSITVYTPPTPGADGNFYLASNASSTGFEKYDGNGSIAKLSLGGTLTTLYFFCGGTNGINCPDGANPWGRLVQASDGNFYGTTLMGGTNYSSCDFGCGTVFRITPSGTFTQLYNFCSLANCADGSGPYGGLIQATDGNLYGTASANTNGNGPGTIFKMTLSGELTVMHSFEGGSAFPLTELVQGTDGSFYGTTSSGSGTVFKFDVGLGPFVRTVPTTGNVGTSVIILGNNLTGTTAVSFNGTPATFTVPSSTEILATVPAAATSGTVQVTTPSGTLASNVPYVVAAPPTAPPNFSPPAGTYYNTAQAITISDVTPGAVIYYTTDGTTPTPSSTLYTGPISIDVTQTLGAIAVAPGYATSEVATAAYTFDFVPVARVSPATLTFAGALVNTTSSAQAVTLSDPGSAPVNISSVAAGGDFAQTNNCGGFLAQGASCTISVTFTPTTSGTLTGTLTITDDNGNVLGSTQSVSLSGAGQDFTLSEPSGTTQTVTPGQTATYTVSVGSSGGMNQSVSFTCSGAPSESTCTISPTSATPGSNVTVTVTTTAPSTVIALRVLPPLSPGAQLLLIFAAFCLGIAGSVLARKRAARRIALLLPLAARLGLALALSSCGGGGGGGGGGGQSIPGTPAGQYTLIITGTSGSGSSALTHTTNLTLTVS